MNSGTNKTAGLTNKQRGFSLSGAVMGMVVLALLALVAAKLVPVYADYFAVKKVLLAIKTSGELSSMDTKSLRLSFSKRAIIDNIKSVDQSDLQFTKASDGTTIINVEYSVKTPLVANVSLIFDFTASTAQTE